MRSFGSAEAIAKEDVAIGGEQRPQIELALVHDRREHADAAGGADHAWADRDEDLLAQSAVDELTCDLRTAFADAGLDREALAQVLEELRQRRRVFRRLVAQVLRTRQVLQRRAGRAGRNDQPVVSGGRR